MSEYSLGVIGGMGPLATAIYFKQLVNLTDAKSDQDNVNALILNHATIPDRTEAILTNNKEPFLASIKKDIELLEKANVTNIAIPCNTSHYYFDDMQAMTNINIINMIDEAMKAVVTRYGVNAKVAILATTGTIHSKVYEKSAKKFNIDTFLPSLVIQDQIMNIIYQVKAGVMTDNVVLEKIIKDLVEVDKCHGVILACTELSTFELNERYTPFYIDSTTELAKKSILLSNRKIK